MLLTPRYDDRPVITVGGDQLDQCESLLRQRRRMESTLARLTDEQWAHSSRCAGWSVKDVVSHLVEVNRFWTRSIRSGVAGNPTRLLATFDPVAMPAHAVDVVRGHAPGEVLARFAETNQALADTVDGLDAHGWSATAEAPPGHLSVRAVAHHASHSAWCATARTDRCPGGASAVALQPWASRPSTVSARAWFVSAKRASTSPGAWPLTTSTACAGIATGSNVASKRVGLPATPDRIDRVQKRLASTRCNTTSFTRHPAHREE